MLAVRVFWLCRASESEPVRQLERGSLKREPQLLVVERVEEVVDGEHHRVLAHEPIRRAGVDDGKVVVIDDWKSRRVEVVVLATLHVATGDTGTEPAEVQVHTGSHRIR